MAVRTHSIFGQILLCYMHSEEQNRNQTEIQYRHYQALGGCDLEVTLFFFGSFAE
jgi:hypothetical protein